MDVQVGDVLTLMDDLGEISAGLWVVVEVGWMITLRRAGENEDGDISTLHRTVKVTHHEIALFVDMNFALEQVTL